MNANARGLALLLVLSLAACGDDPARMVASAKDYMARGDANAAVIQLKSALQKNPDLAEARYLFGMLLLDSGDSGGAERELRKALDKGYPIAQVAVPLAYATIGIGKVAPLIAEFLAMRPTEPEAVAAVKSGLANAYLVTDERPKAEAAIRDALAAKPDYAPAKLTQARLKMVSNDLPAALAALDTLIKDDGIRYEALMLRADIHSLQGKPELALTDFDAAAPLHNQALQPRLRAAQILLGMGRLDEADSRLAQASKLAPNNPYVRFAAGTIALSRGKFETARDAAQQVLRMGPGFVPAMLLAGMAQLQLREFLQAQENLEKVANRAPASVPVRKLLARAYNGSGDAARALETLAPLIDADAPDQETLMVAGEAALNMGDIKRSSEYFDRAAKLDPKDAGTRARLGIARLVGGDAERALGDLEAASSLAGENAGGTGADVALVMVHLRRGEFQKARAIASEYAAKHSDRAFSYNLLGGVLGAAGDKNGERANFEKAFSLDAAYLPAAINLARLDLAAGQTDAARKRFETLIEKSPKNPEAYLVYAHFLSDTRAKPDDIRKALTKGIAANPGATQLRLAELDLLLRTGDKKTALATAQDLVAAFPNDSTALFMAARAQAAAGDIQQAIATMQKVATQRPESPQPLVALADLQRSMKNDAGAEETLVKALRLRPDLVEARQRLVALKIEQRKIPAALTLARELQTLKPQDAAGYEIEGEIQFAARDWNACIAAASRALELSRQTRQAVRLHGALMAAGKTAEADTLATRWIRDNPKDIGMRTYLGERAISARAFDEAAKHYRALVELEPKNAIALNNLAWAAGQIKDPQALSYAERALALAPDSPPLLDTQGQLLVDAGQLNLGVATLKKAVLLAPERADIRLNLARALSKSGDRRAARSEIDTVLKSAAEGSALRLDAEKLLNTL